MNARRFFLHAGGTIGWTDLAALRTLERFYRCSEISFDVDRAFCLCDPCSAHGSGVSFDLGGSLSWKQRQKLRFAAVESGLFSRVATEQLCPDHVHVECLARPVLRMNDCGVFVFALQEILRKQGYYPGVCSGVFDAMTQRAVLRVQTLAALPQTGIADTALHETLSAMTAANKTQRR